MVLATTGDSSEGWAGACGDVCGDVSAAGWTAVSAGVWAGARRARRRGVFFATGAAEAGCSGVSAAVSELGPKNLELIKELFPAFKRIVVLGNEDDPYHRIFRADVEAAGRLLDIELNTVMQRSASRIDAEITDEIEKWRPDALLVQPSIATAGIAELALHYRLPAVSPNPSFVNVGGLISYSADFSAVPRRCAAMIADILRGNKPANIPVQLPERFWLAINLKTAKQLGLDIAQGALARADQFIE